MFLFFVGNGEGSIILMGCVVAKYMEKCLDGLRELVFKGLGSFPFFSIPLSAEEHFVLC